MLHLYKQKESLALPGEKVFVLTVMCFVSYVY